MLANSFAAGIKLPQLANLAFDGVNRLPNAMLKKPIRVLEYIWRFGLFRLWKAALQFLQLALPLSLGFVETTVCRFPRLSLFSQSP